VNLLFLTLGAPPLLQHRCFVYFICTQKHFDIADGVGDSFYCLEKELAAFYVILCFALKLALSRQLHFCFVQDLVRN